MKKRREEEKEKEKQREEAKPRSDKVDLCCGIG
jgi:hypothetical protein